MSGAAEPAPAFAHSPALRDPRICRMIFDELCVLANGDVVCSCGDPSGKRVYGNVHRDALADLYNGPGYAAMRQWQLDAEPSSWCPVLGTPCGGRVSRPEPGDGPLGRRVRTLQIEPISRCNLECPECPVTQFDADPAYRPDRRALLPLATMLEVVDQLPDLEKVLFYNFGEPFLHPQALDFLRTMRARRPGLLLHTSSNGLALGPTTIEALAAEALVDRIVFSIDGARAASYSRYRVGGRLERALANLDALATACRRHGTRDRVEIVWQYILFAWNDSAEELAEARRIAARMGVPVRWIVTHTRGASRRFRPGDPALEEELGVRDSWSVETCDLRADALERGSGIVAGRYLARLTPATGALRVAAGDRFATALEVANDCGNDWPDPDGTRFRIGVRLRDSRGTTLGELPSLPLPKALLRAGGSARLLFDGRAPDEPGRYQLFIDIVEDGVAWFFERGSAPSTIDLDVTAATSAPWQAQDALRAAFRAALSSEAPADELESWARAVQRGTPLATWISWLVAHLPANESEAAANRAQEACWDALGSKVSTPTTG